MITLGLKRKVLPTPHPHPPFFSSAKSFDFYIGWGGEGGGGKGNQL